MTKGNELSLEYRKGEAGIRVHGLFIPFMKEGQKLDVIVCVPKGSRSLEECRMVVPGSQTGHCDRCDQDILIAPSTREVMKEYPDVPTRCIDCVKKELEEASHGETNQGRAEEED